MRGFHKLRPGFSFLIALGLGLQLAFFQLPSFAVTVTDAAKLGQNLPAVAGQGGTVAASTSCTYAATDTYQGPNGYSGYGPGPYAIEQIGAGANGNGSAPPPVGLPGGQVTQPAPPLTDGNNNLALSFLGGSWSSTAWSNGTWATSTSAPFSPLNKPVPCKGTYQVFFTIQLQATFYGGNQNPPQDAPTITVNPCVQTTGTPPKLVYGSLLVNGACPSSGPFFTFTPKCNGGNYCSVVTFPFATQVSLDVGDVVGPPAIHSSSQVAVTGGEFSVYYVGP